MNQTSKLVLDVPRASLTLILDFVGRGSDRNTVIGGGTADVELLIVEDDPFVGCWLQDETVLKYRVKGDVQIEVVHFRPSKGIVHFYLILWIQSSVLDPSVGLRLTLDPDPQTENESEFRSKLNFEIGMLVRDIYSFASFFLHKIKQVSNKNKCRSRDF